MTQFLAVPASPLFDRNLYVQALEREIFTGNSSKDMQRTKAFVRTLWQQFNPGRSTLDKRYMDEAKNIQGYLAGFLLPNVQRLLTVLSMEELAPSLRNLCSQKETLELVDFGAGPLTGTVAFLCALNALNLERPTKVRIWAVERSERIFEKGVALLRQAVSDQGLLEVTLVTSVDKLDQKIDIAIAANVLNEIPEKHRTVTASRLLTLLNAGGLGLLMEPGQDVHSRSLAQVRDEILEANPALSPLAPCFHRKKCPLGPAFKRKDWCWFQTSWERPTLQHEIDDQTELDHSVLNFSFAAFIKGGKGSYPFARVVSDPIHIDSHQKAKFTAFSAWARANAVEDSRTRLEQFLQTKDGLSKHLLCTNTGELQSHLEPARDSRHSLRGQIFAREEDANCRCRERTEGE